MNIIQQFEAEQIARLTTARPYLISSPATRCVFR